jgi:xylulokinase
MNATNVVNRTLQALDKTISDIDLALAATEPGAEGLTTMPFHNGERTPDMPHARGSIIGFTANNFTPSNMIRSVIEGVTFGILNGLDRILGGDKPEKILVIGGGSRSAAWRQLLADATGAVIQVPVEEEAGCLGAAIQAIYQHHLEGGREVTFGELADRLVKIDEAKTANARSDQYEPYLEARRTYTLAVERLYPR